MLCVILKRPEDVADSEIEIEFDGKPSYGERRAILKWPRGRAPKSLIRLSEGSWTRKHAYGYIRLKSGGLYKIDGIDSDTVGGPRTLLYLISISDRFKIAAYCKCGGAMSGSFGTRDRTRAQQCLDVFYSVHNREECGQTDALTAEKARRRRKALKKNETGNA